MTNQIPGQSSGFQPFYGNGANDNYFPGQTDPNFGNGGGAGVGNLGAYYQAPGTIGSPAGAGGGGAMGGGGLYGFAPASPNPNTLGNNTGGGLVSVPSYGQYGQALTPGMTQQQLQERYSVTKAPSYGDYEVMGTNAQNAALYGQNVLNNPQAAGALAAQQNQAGGPSAQQLSAQSYQNSALANLQQAAAGNGPTAADIQGQKSISDAMHAQLTAGASARGGAYQQAGAMQQAGVNAAGIQAQGAAGAAQLRAQEMQAAQQGYAQAAQGAVGGANQAYIGQSQALGSATQAAQGEQGLGLNYYNQLANLYNSQSGQAATLASNQVANDYGLAGTQAQTSTQQNIANQQQQQSYIGAGIAAAGLIAAAASTGGAQAAAKGAREHGASEHEAAAIGAHVGQALGMARLGPAVATAAKPADTAAAKRGAMTPDEMHAHMAKLRASGKKQAPLPGPETEPMAAHAYAAGSHLAALAKMHAAQQHGRTHAVVGRP